MSSSPPPQQQKPQKISREMSNLIVKLVLERSDDLIRNSYRRLTTENVARNEHWQRIAEAVAAHFGQPIDADRIKQHFHNRKKVLIARIKDELKSVGPGVPTSEKLEILIGRRIFSSSLEEELAKICLEIEDEERKATSTDMDSSHLSQIFGEQAHQSLLSQLLSSTNVAECNGAMACSSRESDPPTTHAPLLSKLLSQSTKETDSYLSHLIVDVTSPNELKRLLSVLIDHGFYRFSHVDSISQIIPVRNAHNGVINHHFNENFTQIENNIFKKDDDDALIWNGGLASTSVEEAVDGDFDVHSISDRVERVDVEVKTESLHTDQNSMIEDQEAMLAEVQQKSMALFDRKSPDLITTSPAPKRARCIDAPTVPCLMCGSVIRLNAGGSKWNLFEHVVLKHSDHRPFKCSQCPYEAARKIRIRQHATSLHGSDAEPVDNVTPLIRKQWSATMARCFPTHQYGATKTYEG